VTNFEKRWAWFFVLAGWQWEYFPSDHGFLVQPAFRVCIPCGHSECYGSHTLDVFLRRVAKIEGFGLTVLNLASLRPSADSTWDSPHPALFGMNPSVTIWQMPHGAGGGEECVPAWVPNWKAMWKAARSLTCYSAAQPVGSLR